MSYSFALLTIAVLCPLLSVFAAMPEFPRLPPTGHPDPEIRHFYPITPTLLAVTVTHGRVTVNGIVPYTALPGDEIVNADDRVQTRFLRRSGQPVGTVLGRDRSHLWQYDRFENTPLDTKLATTPDEWTVTLDGTPVEVVRIDRKTRPTGMARTGEWAFGWPLEHTLYLHLARPVVAGSLVRIELRHTPKPIAPFERRFNPDTHPLPALAISHIGYAPADEKHATFSQWRGDGGATPLPDPLPFRVVRDDTGDTVLKGISQRSFVAGTAEDAYGADHTRTDVHRLDFSSLTVPGTYRVVLDGLGCSRSFTIGAGVYDEVVVKTLRGLYVHRSGIALGPPHTPFVRPRPMHPDDGFPIYIASTRALEPLAPGDAQSSIFTRLQASPKDRTHPTAWGGYMDAGDWDRREPHLLVNRMLLELFEVRPDFARTIRTNIPESDNDLPDLVDEALFNIDFYRRIQNPDGGVPGWIESIEHPRQGEVSWLESLDVFVVQPDPHATFHYAASAAQAATVLRSLGKPVLADGYLASARAAFDWAEQRHLEGGYEKPSRDYRNLAALLLYRETREDRYHRIFLETTFFKDPAASVWEWSSHDQRQAAFYYALLHQQKFAGIDPAIAANAQRATLREAQDWSAHADTTAYRISKNPYAPIAWGTVGGPHAWSSARAYLLTGEPAHLRAVQRSVQYILGANPLDMAMISGLGPNPVKNLLHLDSRNTAQPLPEGINAYGPIDPAKNSTTWNFPILKDHIHPAHTIWPTMESYFDVFWLVPANEYTVMQTNGPNAYLFGLLAAEARAASKPSR
jgi:endoglucanase